VTTPESLYVLLGSESGRRMLATTRSVIVDEIHALAAGKRGSHLALSLERLQVAVRASAGADRAVGDAEAGRRSCAVSWSAQRRHRI
jgi:Lhr-like helicase